MALTNQQKTLLYSFACEDATHKVYSAFGAAQAVLNHELIEAEDYYDLIWNARNARPSRVK
jgi:hypothetical protein